MHRKVYKHVNIKYFEVRKYTFKEIKMKRK